jgi:hypothetical protein
MCVLRSKIVETIARGKDFLEGWGNSMKQMNTTRFFITEECESIDDFAAEVELDSAMQTIAERLEAELILRNMDDHEMEIELDE